MLDKDFCVVLKLSTRRAVCDRFFGDKFVIRDSRYITPTFLGIAAGASTRPGASWNVVVCLQLEGADYQPKQDRMGDLEQVI